MDKNWYVIEKIFKRKGFVCAVLFLDMGYRCGYVQIPKDHKLFGKELFEPELERIDVHGGITFSEMTEGYPIEGKSWFIGFDCNHGSDASDPEQIKKYMDCLVQSPWEHLIASKGFGKKRSLSFCVNECNRIVDQLIRDYGEIKNERV